MSNCLAWHGGEIPASYEYEGCADDDPLGTVVIQPTAQPSLHMVGKMPKRYKREVVASTRM